MKNILYIGPLESKSLSGIQSRHLLHNISQLNHNIYAKSYGAKDIELDQDLFFLTSKPIITDIDGNSYRTVWINDELWFAENLRSSNYNDGTPIPNVIDSIEWGELTIGARSYYDNDSSKYDTIYGALYNFFAVETSKLCPTGWHVPTDDEWTELTDYLGGENVAGGKLKDIGTVHWDSPNTDATDTVGFTALPGGRRTLTGTFDDSARKLGAWWSATLNPNNSDESWYRLLDYNFAIVFEPFVDTRFGFSVRCLKA